MIIGRASTHLGYTSVFLSSKLVITSPLQLPNLNMWWDASIPANFSPSNIKTGQNITQWSDSSGKANNLAGGQTKPNYYTGSTTNPYKIGVVQFTPNDDFTSGTISAIAGVPGITMFVVSQFTGSTNGTSQTVTNTQFNDMNLSISGTTSRYIIGMAGGIGTDSGSTVDNNFHIHTIGYDGSQPSNATKLTYRRDSIQSTLDFGATTVGTTTNSSDNTLFVGSTFVGPTNYMTGFIAEIIVCTQSLTTTQVQATETYLKTKWGL